MATIEKHQYSETSTYGLSLPTGPDSSLEHSPYFRIELERARWRKDGIEVNLRVGRFRLCSFQTPKAVVEMLGKMCFQATYFEFPPKADEGEEEG